MMAALQALVVVMVLAETLALEVQAAAMPARR